MPSRPARDAWIETKTRANADENYGVPQRVRIVTRLRRVPHGTRGLKLMFRFQVGDIAIVASRTGRVD